MKIAFVGAGHMGRGMAANLLRAGHELAVIAHRNRAPIEALVEAGAREAGSYRDLAAGAEAVVLCVTGTPAARAVVAALAPHLGPGALVVDTTTNAPDGPEALAAELAAVGVRYVEAPVTGGVEQAAAGLLGAIVGCPEEDFAPAEALLSAFCRRVERFGPVGAATRAKLVSNFLALGTATLVVEAFKQARALGVDWHKLYGLAQLGSGNSAALKRILDAALEGDYGGYVFSIENTAKDLSYFCRLAEANGDLPELAPVLLGLYERAVAEGHGEHLLSERLAPDLDELR